MQWRSTGAECGSEVFCLKANTLRQKVVGPERPTINLNVGECRWDYMVGRANRPRGFKPLISPNLVTPLRRSDRHECCWNYMTLRLRVQLPPVLQRAVA